LKTGITGINALVFKERTVVYVKWKSITWHCI